MYSPNPNLTTAAAALQLKLSVEHSGFAFERNPEAAIEKLQLHSGGKVSKALEKALNLVKETE